jgi:hypothetical protein
MPGPLLIGQRQLTEVDLSRIAREIARDIQPLEILLERAGINSEQFERIKQNPIFQTRLMEEAQIWSSTTKQNLRERVSIKAAVAIEELLLDTVNLIRDPDIPGAARVQGLQFLAKLGHLGEGPLTKDDGSGRVQINILIGGQKLSFDKESTVIEGEVVTPGVSEHA